MMPESASSRSTSAGPNSRDGFGVEAAEGLPVRLPALQDRDPAQARLRGLEHEELEVPALVVHGHAPLLVVVGLQEGTVAQAQRDGSAEPAPGRGLRAGEPRSQFCHRRSRIRPGGPVEPQSSRSCSVEGRSFSASTRWRGASRRLAIR